MRAKGLPQPHRQYVVKLPNGRSATLDLAFPPQKYGLEWRGREFHSGFGAEEYDFDRAEALKAAGWTVDYVGGSLLHRRPDAIIAMIERGLGLRAS